MALIPEHNRDLMIAPKGRLGRLLTSSWRSESCEVFLDGHEGKMMCFHASFYESLPLILVHLQPPQVLFASCLIGFDAKCSSGP